MTMLASQVFDETEIFEFLHSLQMFFSVISSRYVSKTRFRKFKSLLNLIWQHIKNMRQYITNILKDHICYYTAPSDL